MTPAEVVARARHAIGKGIIYKLGAGGKDPARALPATAGACDCSGFVAWCLGLPRRQPETIGWIETSRMVRDARGANLLFVEVLEPQPGDVIVYPDRNGRQGHCGIVSQVDGGLRVIHCASRGLNDAIRETSAARFLASGAIFARPRTS